MKTWKKYLHIAWIVILFVSCHQEFLDLKRDRKQVIPVHLRDYQAIVDNMLMNTNIAFSIGDLGADDLFVADEQFNLAPTMWERNAYLWKNDIFEQEQSLVWNAAYERILYANLTLEGLEKLSTETAEKNHADNIKGSALYFRAYTNFQLAQFFCNDYNQISAEHDPGIPLKKTADLNEKVQRGTVAETYEHIITDLKQALVLFNPSKEIHKNRPTKESTLALLARVYLQMENYENALRVANELLQSNSKLMDYNSVNGSVFFPFTLYGEDNPEHLIIDQSFSCALLNNSRMQISRELLSLYEEGDLRKTMFYIEDKGKIVYRGSYNGTRLFSGSPTISEVILIRAESHARLNNMDSSLKDLIYLLSHRYSTESPPSLEIDNPEELLTRILLERRKELAFRGLRWSDLRRLNKEPRFEKTLIRINNGEEFRLLPLDKRYTWPIPDNEMLLSGIEQNSR